MASKDSLNEKQTFLCKSPEILTGPQTWPNWSIVMHPSTMKRLQYVKGQQVLIHNEGGQMLFRCWSHPSVQQSTIMVPLLNIFRGRLKGTVLIQNYSLLIDSAYKIILTSDNHKSFMTCQVFKEFLHNKLEDYYLREGLEFNITYLGYPCHFTVKKIMYCVTDEIVNQAYLDNICGNISSLDISKNNSILENSVDESSITCSTPISSKSTASSKNLLFVNMKLDDIKKNIFGKQQQFYHVHSRTNFIVRKVVVPVNQIKFQHLGGLRDQINKVKSLITSIYSQGKENCGILLVGPPGTGKSMLVQALESEFFFPVFNLKKFTGGRKDAELRNQLQTLFKEAVNNSPCILFLDDIDSFSTNLKNSSEPKIIHLLSTLICNTLNSEEDVVIIGAARDILAVDAALRKPSALEKEINFEIPSADDRKEILSKILENKSHCLSPKQVCEISERAHGFTGGDLKELCNKASTSYGKTDCINIGFEELKNIVKDMKPSSVAEFTLEVPNVKWSDIGGMQTVKTAIIEMVDWPLNHADQLKKFKITPSRGILLYGPPGCSKTMIAKALVTESHLNFISIKGPQLFNKYVGGSEKAVSDLFKKARSAAPCVLFFDEFDSLVSIRGSTTGNSNVTERILNQLLTEIDGIDVFYKVSIIAATNRPDMIDSGFLRPGRFDKKIYVPLPDAETRKEIFEVKTKKKPLGPDVDISYLVKATENYTGAEIADLCNEAAFRTLDNWIESAIKDSPKEVIKMDHFLTALKFVLPKTTKDMVAYYENYNNS